MSIWVEELQMGAYNTLCVLKGKLNHHNLPAALPEIQYFVGPTNQVVRLW